VRHSCNPQKKSELRKCQFNLKKLERISQFSRYQRHFQESELHEHILLTFLYVPAQVACPKAMKSATRSDRVNRAWVCKPDSQKDVSRFSWNISLFSC